MNPLETLIIRRQQSFELHNQLNPVQITINNDRVLNILKSIKIANSKLVYCFRHLYKMIQNNYI